MWAIKNMENWYSFRCLNVYEAKMTYTNNSFGLRLLWIILVKILIIV